MPAAGRRPAPARTVIPIAASVRTVIRGPRVITATDDDARLNNRRSAVISPVARIVVDTGIAAAIRRAIGINRAAAEKCCG
jgi:hypothetical protein